MPRPGLRFLKKNLHTCASLRVVFFFKKSCPSARLLQVRLVQKATGGVSRWGLKKPNAEKYEHKKMQGAAEAENLQTADPSQQKKN